MITGIVIMILSQVSSPEIQIDENGFVTLIETPEACALEQKNIALLAEADRAYSEYRKHGAIDASTVIEIYEDVLESGMELDPDVQRTITSRLTDLHRKCALAPTDESKRHLKVKPGATLQEKMSQAEIEALMEVVKSENYRNHTSAAINFNEETIARLPEEERMEAARLLLETAMMSQSGNNLKAPREVIIYYLRARQKALEALEHDTCHKFEAQSIADLSLFIAINILRHEASVDLCREMIVRFTEDKNLAKEIKAIIENVFGKQ